MRPIDGDYISDALEAELCREGDDLEDRQWAYGYAAGVSFAVRKLAEAPTLTPPNEPLTLKELREMDDEPVWCCPKNDSAKGSWMIVGPNGCENITSFAIYDDYGTGWLAYRRPPEVSP